MRKIIFLSGLVTGAVIGLSAPVWADNDSPRVAALEARLAAMEARLGDGQRLTLDAGRVLTLEAGDEIRLRTGSASLSLRKNGQITLEGQGIDVKDKNGTTVKGSKILSN
ncbi:hypothetical protein [Asticcacaulis sp. YBE204]|uniref:hypothetical protein n=1 Tax=Asticcacaulis sp. YBE204 TaxID=1282363 RepID=UPI0003C3E2AA|nr:hypothetical protein [Asticcacaulis sp. YBE204]ESQ80617.1 hypothetical protein AEYBE204_04930 [Asticcacaulis sp. YBE204]